MRFRTLAALTLSIAMIGTVQTGYASEPEFEIEQEELFLDVMNYYSNGFTVTSKFYPSAYKIAPIVMPSMAWPTDDKTISSDYGWRPRPCNSCSSDHKGIDFVPGRGEPVYAAMDGIISRIDYGNSFGQHVYIDHIANFNDEKFYNWQTIYAHLEIGTTPENIRVGSIVKAGDIIGTVGNTGTSTGAHLHFELLIEGENVDPEKYLLMYGN